MYLGYDYTVRTLQRNFSEIDVLEIIDIVREVADVGGEGVDIEGRFGAG
jgi:hypothetical protein